MKWQINSKKQLRFLLTASSSNCKFSTKVRDQVITPAESNPNNAVIKSNWSITSLSEGLVSPLTSFRNVVGDLTFKSLGKEYDKYSKQLVENGKVIVKSVQSFQENITSKSLYEIQVPDKQEPVKVVAKPIVYSEEKAIELCHRILYAENIGHKATLLKALCELLYAAPELRQVVSFADQQSIVPHLLQLSRSEVVKDKDFTGNVNKCLAMLGIVDNVQVRNRGINILALDGGGAKGIVSIEVLKNIERQCGGKPIHEIFDYICGVSTGAVLATLIGIYRKPLDEIERIYKEFSKVIFQRNKAAGFGNLLMSYSYYDTACWEAKLKEVMGETLVIDSAREKDACKLSIVTNITTANMMKVYLFRNYNLPIQAYSHYDGTCKFKTWEAVRASSAAPGYYEDFKLGGHVFHDGGLLANNPTHIAIHESKHIWPSHETNCVVSIGTGRYEPEGYGSIKCESISLKQKINRIVAGIGSPEHTHTMLLDLLPPKMYFRFNPYMTEEFQLDESRPEKWNIMQYDANMYLRRNDYKFKMAVERLFLPKTTAQKLGDFLKLKSNSI